MISIQEVVEEIVLSDEEALSSLNRGYMSLARYARRIQKDVEARAKKEAGIPAIVVSLSRLKKTLRKAHPLVEDVEILNITTRAPLSEISFEKTPESLDKISSLYKKLRTNSDDFFTIIISATDITIICSDRLKDEVLEHFDTKPHLMEGGLASIGLAIDPKYYTMPNITYSLLRKVASKRIALAETVTAHREITFIFKQAHLPEMLQLFQITKK